MLQLQHKNSGKGPLWLVDKKYVVGCDASCTIKIPKTSATERFAELLVNGDDIELINISDDEAPKVNGIAVRGKKALVAGDVISIGDEELVILDPKQRKRQASGDGEAQAGSDKTPTRAFKALNTALAEKQFPLAKTQTLGRSNECDISLGVVHLSRKHAKVTVTETGLLIEDLESSNGTYINSKKISRGTALAGDEVSFDTLRFRVIGPVLDSNKTFVRSGSDGDLTTIRPAINLADHDIVEKKSDASVKPAPRKPAPMPVDDPAKPSSEAKPTQGGAYVPEADKQTTKSVEVEQPTKKTNSGGILLVLLLVVIGGIGAWYFLGRG